MFILLLEGHYDLFLLALFAIIFSLTCHEFSHALAAKLLGDDTAEQAGRLNLNPMSHIDPMGLLMVMVVSFGYAKPVPVNPSNLKYPWADAVVAFAGPLMNIILAVVAVNLFAWSQISEASWLAGDSQVLLLILLAKINLLLALFNLIPLGPLDGHYILPWFLPQRLRYPYHQFNARYGTMILLSLIALNIVGVPIFSAVMGLADRLVPRLIFL